MANERIISLSPSITEIVYALGDGDKLVGTTTYSLYPSQAKKLPRIGSYVSINIEKVYALKPTLIIAQEFQAQSVAKFKKLNLDVLEVDLHSIKSIKSSILKLGKRLNKEKKALELVANIDKAIKTAKKTKKQKRVLVVFGLRDDIQSRIYISGNKLFYNEILEICGAKNAYQNPKISQPVLNLENIFALNPDTILILSPKESSQVKNQKQALQKWLSLPIKATLNKDIHIIDDDYISVPSHRIAKTIKRICKEL
jgi:iron complex transport system substrate-binding protein